MTIDEAIVFALKQNEIFGGDMGEFLYNVEHWLEELKSLKGAYEQVVWERNIAIEQLRELGGEFGEKPELIKDRIYNKAIDDFANKLKEMSNNSSTKYIRISDYDTNRDMRFYNIEEIAEQLKGEKDEIN